MATCKSSGYQVACDGELFWDDYGGTDACCPTGQVCCDEEGYCCDPDFTALHVGLSIPIFVFAALQIGVAILRYSSVGSKRTALLCFGIGNFIFWFLIGLGVTPLCGEDVTGRAQKTSGDDYKWWYSTYFSPEGDCTTNLIICWSVAGGIAFFTFVGALCRASSVASHTTDKTPADVVQRTKAGTPTLALKFECYHKTTHTDSKGRSHTSTHYTKRGTYQMPLDLLRDDLSQPMPDEFKLTNHATTLDLGTAYEPSATLVVQRDAVKLAIDAQWVNYDSYYRSWWTYEVKVERPGGAGVWDCYPNLTPKQLEAVRARGYYLAFCNCFATLMLAFRPRDTEEAKYEVSFGLKAVGESTGAVLTPAALAMEAVASTLGGPGGTLTAAVAAAPKTGGDGGKGVGGPSPDASAYPAAASLPVGQVTSPSGVPVAVADHHSGGVYSNPAAIPSAYPAARAYAGPVDPASIPAAYPASSAYTGATAPSRGDVEMGRMPQSDGGAGNNNGKGGAGYAGNENAML